MLINLGYLTCSSKNKYYLMATFPNIEFKNLFQKLFFESFLNGIDKKPDNILSFKSK
jgi:hypothetical protein